MADIVQGVALLALVQVRCSRKLACMSVAVTVCAKLKFDVVERVLPFRNMTLRALQARMAALQRIGGGSVLFHSKLGGLESVHRMAGGTLPAIRSFRELPVMGIGLWQSAHFSKTMAFLKSPCAWHCTHSTCACFPSNGYFVFE